MHTAFSGSPAGITAGSVFTTLLAVAAVSDLRTRRIPNELVALLAVIGLICAVLVAPGGFRNGVSGGVGVLVGFGLWLPFYLMGWLGAGDVKLFAASGAWLGPALTLDAAITAALIGGLLAVVWMVRRDGVKNTAVTASLMATAPRAVTMNGSDRRGAVPYGVALSIGVLLIALVQGGLFGVWHAAR